MPKINLLVDEQGSRLDAYIAANSPLSRSNIQKLIKETKILVNGQSTSSSYKTKLNDSIDIEYEEFVLTDLKPADIDVDIIYEDDDVIVINKQKGLVVHPAPGNYDNTLVNALLFKCKDLSNVNGLLRPGIVHRIDKDTQGLLAVALNEETQALLQQEIRDREFHRSYLALVYGDVPDKKFRIEAPLTKPNHSCRKAKVDIYNGRDAITHCIKLSSSGKVSLLKCTLETGRTHQIRAHLAYIGYPLVGDPLYGKIQDDNICKEGQLLTAYSLSLIHPFTMKRMTFYTPIDDYFKKVLKHFYK